jgi:c-di-GMP-binding flagellar brake protein YcgR
MAEPISLLPVRPSEVAVGAPLALTVYDWHGNVLLLAGSVVQSEKELDDILSKGYVQDATWDLKPKDPAPVPAAAAAKPKAAETSEPKAQPLGKEVVVGMDEVHWHIGESMQLQPHDNLGMRYGVQLIGFLKNRTVLVTAPAVDGKVVMVREGQTFVVRAFSGKKAYAFTAAVLKAMHTPHAYLLLSYPKEVRCTVVRQSARVDVKIIASASVGKPERTSAATIFDLSMGGASATAKEPLGVKGEEGRLKFKVNAAESDAYLNIGVILRSIAKMENGEGYKHGFEFVDVSAHDRLTLSAFVYQTLAEID